MLSLRWVVEDICFKLDDFSAAVEKKQSPHFSQALEIYRII